MLPNPLTPPPDGVEDGQVNASHNPSTTSNIIQFATPTSNIDTPLDSSDSRSDSTEEQSDGEAEHQEMSDEDLEDGGAALTLTVSNISELNHELDNTDVQAVATNNLLHQFLYPVPFFSTGADDFLFSDSFPPPQEPDIPTDQMDVAMDAEDEQHSGAQDYGGVPITINEVAQQLQHLQEVQEHADLQDAPMEQHAVINNSITPFHFPLVQFSTNASSFPAEGYTVISNSDITFPFPPTQLSLEDLDTEPQVLPPTTATWEEGDADPSEVEDNINFSLGDFLYDWGSRAATPQTSDSRKRCRGPSMPELHAQRFPYHLDPVRRKDLQGEQCDIQRIDWQKLGVSRFEARQRRRQTYKNYTNLRISSQWHPRLHGAQISDEENFFKFRRMDFDHTIHLSHFQLRNLISCASRDHVFYAGRSRVVQWNPTNGTQGPKRTAIDLRVPMVHPFHGSGFGIQISTLSVEHNILVAGGFSGEYALVNLRAHKDTKHTEGIVTSHQNSITNHVQVHLSRTSYSPRVAIASNDNGLRILDVESNKFVADHSYDHAINCSAVSPDQRLRVLVGDSRQVLICNSETGEILQSLEGHRDFGFACDWADDGWTVATGNQDMQIKIWDARKWTTSNGLAFPVTTIAAEMAGVRKLKFSPLGSGKKVLVAAEPADMVSVIDAGTYGSKQLLSFFGEIGGFDFTNGGRDLIVANCDSMRGGLMEFERCNNEANSFFEMDGPFEERLHKRHKSGAFGHDWRSTDEETTRHPSSWGTTESRKRNTTLLGSQIGHF